MTYWNPIERYGVDAFARDLAAAGGIGAITPDLIPDEAGEWLKAVAAHALDPVFLAAPSSADDRLKVVARNSSGFIYAASTMGVTGARDAVSNRAHELVRRLRAVTDLPIAVGLGLSNGGQAAEVAAYADGVIVGSALVRCLLDDDGDAGRAALHDLAGDLAEGVRGK
jgi:tryptophan synthase alpha chain